MVESWISGERLLLLWPVLFVAIGIGVGIWTGFFKARKIQPRGFKWKTFRNEALVAVVTITFSATVLGAINNYLVQHGFIRFDSGPAPWWRIAGEYIVYFLLFDTWFYWFHRLMHREPFYRWVHKLHHRSTSPNMLTTYSETPFEAFVNGGFFPVFLCIFTVHDATAAMMVPTSLVLGLYSHSGYEFLPRWWNRSWATKWFITATYHDQHHRYFTGNFGGYTTIWDRICGTMRPKYESDFERFRQRPAEVKQA